MPNDDCYSGRENRVLLLKQPVVSGLWALLVSVLCWGGYRMFEWFWRFWTDGLLPG